MAMNYFLIGKLIRDHLPQMMRNGGILVQEQCLDSHEYIQKLREKCVEEAQEVFAAKTEQELREELSDMLEVISALAASHGWTLQDIEQSASEKSSTKGGFKNGVYVHGVGIPSEHPSIDHYRSRPESYPEITAEDFQAFFAPDSRHPK